MDSLPSSFFYFIYAPLLKNRRSLDLVRSSPRDIVYGNGALLHSDKLGIRDYSNPFHARSLFPPRYIVIRRRSYHPRPLHTVPFADLSLPSLD